MRFLGARLRRLAKAAGNLSPRLVQDGTSNGWFDDLVPGSRIATGSVPGHTVCDQSPLEPYLGLKCGEPSFHQGPAEILLGSPMWEPSEYLSASESWGADMNVSEN